MATAELAAALPVLVLVLAVVLAAVSVASARVRAQDAAREAVRAAARGDLVAAHRLAAAAAPGGRVALGAGGGAVTATVSLRVAVLGGVLPGVTVTEHASAAAEPDLTGTAAGGGPAP